MRLVFSILCVMVLVLGVRCHAQEADWRQFRGPGGQGVSGQTGLPVKWSGVQNVLWKTALPGYGASSPITVGKRIFVTCYSGYGLDKEAPGDQTKLSVHLLCIDRDTGKIQWNKDIAAGMHPDDMMSRYGGFIARHGYASSTPVSDGKAVYVFYARNGVFAFDLEGQPLWRANVGKERHGFGSGASPMMSENLVIVNASIESSCLIALDKTTGKEVWRAPDINESYNTPVLVTAPGGKQELVVITNNKLLAFDPGNGQLLWQCAGSRPPQYLCPSAVTSDGIVYAVHGYHGPATAVRSGGRGDVTATHQLWSLRKGTNVSSPVYYQGHLYWVNQDGIAFCVDAANGKLVYQERLDPRASDIYASPIVADGKIYYVSRGNGTFVVAAQPKFELLSHNLIDDDSIFNASPIVSGKGLLLRSDKFLYYIGNK